MRRGWLSSHSHGCSQINSCASMGSDGTLSPCCAWTWTTKHQAGLEVLCATDSSGLDHSVLWLSGEMGRKLLKVRRAKIHAAEYTKYILITLNTPWERNFLKSIFCIHKNFAFERMCQLFVSSPALKVQQMKAVVPTASVISRISRDCMVVACSHSDKKK